MKVLKIVKDDKMISEKQNSLTPGHIPVLDGVRGLAILLVMLSHQTVMAGSGNLQYFKKIMSFGWCGVDLFFVLSGFLITGILYDSKNKPHYFKNFYLRRILRIFPLYYGILFFTLIILPHFPHPKLANYSRIQGAEIWYWIFLQNYAIAYSQAWRHGILDVTWSLAIEEQFYLFWPIVILLLDRIKLINVCILLIIFALISRLIILFFFNNEFACYVITICRFDALAIGALLALIFRQEDAMKKLTAWFKPIAAISFLIVLLLIFLGGTTKVIQGTPGLLDRYGYTFIALFFGCLIGMVLNSSFHKGILARSFENPILMLFGKYSYAMYLIHLPLRGFIRDYIFKPAQFKQIVGSELVGQLIFYVISMSITFLLAFLIWHSYEKHFLGLKKFFA